MHSRYRDGGTGFHNPSSAGFWATTALHPIAYPAQMDNVQMLVLTLTLSGFLIGIAVDMAQRASDELRQSQRLAAAGEMAAALAHELNQPLTALAAYGSACQRLVARNGGDPLLQKTIASMAASTPRATSPLTALRASGRFKVM